MYAAGPFGSIIYGGSSDAGGAGGSIAYLSGVCTTNAGTPIAINDEIVSVVGVCTTQVGAPQIVIAHAPEGAISTRFGAIAAAYDVSVDVPPPDLSTRCGTPLAWLLNVSGIATVHDAYGVCATGYGAVRASHPQLSDVQGVSVCAYGAPSAAALAQSAPASTTAAGTPSATAVASVAGVRGTQYGTPANVVAHIVTGVCRTKYGRPRAAFPDAHMVYGLNNGRRAGVPRAVEIA